MKKEIKLRYYQQEAVNSIFQNIQKWNRLLCIVLCVWAGKALEDNEPVLTNNGYIPIKDIAKWDTVFWKKGEPINVVWVFPQGERKTYRVTFSDKTSILADWEHIWEVRRINRKDSIVKYITKTTSELLGDLVNIWGRSKWFLPIVEPIQFSEKELEFPPYLLWALLGDGSFRGKSYQFSNIDWFIINKVDKELNKMGLYLQHSDRCNYNISQDNKYKHNNKLKLFCKKYWLDQKYSYEKHIPKHYLMSSIEQRKLILAWLLDTDGTVDKRLKWTFTTTSQQLCEDIVFLLQSLWATPRITTRVPKFTYKWIKKNWRLAYTVTVNTEFTPFTVERHIKRYEGNKKLTPRKIIKNIEYIGYKNCTCIKVDSEDELFVANNCTLTHNTITFSFVAKKAIESGKKVLVLAHREELLTQAQEALQLVNPDSKIMIEQGKLTADVDSDIIVASVASLGRKWSDRIKKFNKSDFWLIIVDEMHHITSDTYTRVLDYFGAYKSADNGTEKWHPVVLGVTATSFRWDWVSLDKVIDTIAYKYDMQQAISEGHLSPIRAFTVFTDTDISNVKTSMWDFAIGELSDAVNNTERNLQIIETYKTKGKEEKSIIFAVDVQHAKDISALFIEKWVKANYITWALKKDTRKQILKDFHENKINVLVNVWVLVEGFNQPDIINCLLVRPTKSSWLYIQMVWRASRLSPWKEFWRVFDFVDNMRNNKIVTATSLIWISQPIQAEDTDIFEMKDKLEELLNNKPWTNLRELDLDKIEERIQEVDIFAAAELDTFVKENSSFGWTPFLTGYKISLGTDDSGDKLSVEIREDLIWKYLVEFIVAKKQDPNFKNKHKKFKNKVVASFEANDKKQALSLSDKVIKTNYSDRVNLVSQSAWWKKESPTEKQITMLKKNWYPNADQLTKGQASTLISKIFTNKWK